MTDLAKAAELWRQLGAAIGASISAPAAVGQKIDASDPFEAALAHTLAIEGGYSNHPSDTGGKTNWGITEAVARRHGYKGDMKALPKMTAVTIYRKDYWDALHLDSVVAHSRAIALELFDTGVNMGPGKAAEFLQRSLNALNAQGKLYADIKVDGSIGLATLHALDDYFAKRAHYGEIVLLRALEALQGARYIELAEGRQANEDFLFGWLRTRIGGIA